MKFGGKLPLKADYPLQPGIPGMASALEQAGYDSIWCGDHTCMPASIESHYPFSPDGVPHWDPRMAWYDVVVGLAVIAATTSRVRLGTAVLILPLRNALIMAKQAAALQRISGGRLELGIGIGWLEEEFDALGVDFRRRGAICDESLTLMREAWAGTLATAPEGSGEPAAEFVMEPTPGTPIPVLVGGMSNAALRRVARSGDGWLAVQNPRRFDLDRLRHDLDVLRRLCKEGNRDFDALRLVFSMSVSQGLREECARLLPVLQGLGFEEVLIDIDWERDGDVEAVITTMRGAL